MNDYINVAVDKYGSIVMPCFKELTHQEKQYLQSISNGLDNQLLLMSEWLKTDEAAELFTQNRQEVNRFFRESGISNRLKELIQSNAEDSETFITQFYSMGSSLGYSSLHRDLVLTPADKEAAFFLKNYNFDLVKNVNDELRQGIKETVLECILAGDGPKVCASKLSELPLTPIKTNMSVKTRAEMIARTESARAQTTGTLQAYCNYGVDMIEVITVGDELVCDICLDAEEHNPHLITDTENLPPFHPNCRCSIGAVVEDIGLLPASPIEDPVIVNLIPT